MISRGAFEYKPRVYFFVYSQHMETPATVKTVKRNELIRRSFSLFYQHGFHATGVDTILSGTGISKRTLYKYFSSKEDLVVSAIQYYHQTNLQAILNYIDSKNPETGVEKILALFDFLTGLADSVDFRGCLALNAKSEYAQTVTEISNACSDYNDAIRDLINSFLLQDGYKDTLDTAKQIGIIFSGAVMHCSLVGNAQPSILARNAVKLILKSV
jgi:AcrR family transcriptional regulator